MDATQGSIDHARTDSGAFGTLVNAGAAAVSLTLILGLGLWAYQLAMRDVAGVPVVEALAGPMRVAPDEPGGRQAAHQGLSVNAVPGAVDVAPAEAVTLAPGPLDILEEDTPPPAPLPEVTRAAASATDLAVAEALLNAGANPGNAAPATPLSNSPLPEDPVAAALALADRVAAGAVPLSPIQDTVAPETEATNTIAANGTGQGGSDALGGAAGTDASAAEALTSALAVPAVSEPAPTPVRIATLDPSIPGVAASPRPPARPAALSSRVASRTPDAALLAASAEESAERAAADVPAGTRMVQLGAFDSAEVARAEWTRLSGRFGDYLDGKTRVVQQATTAGKTFYRLRAMPFDDLGDARRFCAALTAGNAACIPVIRR